MLIDNRRTRWACEDCLIAGDILTDHQPEGRICLSCYGNHPHRGLRSFGDGFWFMYVAHANERLKCS